MQALKIKKFITSIFVAVFIMLYLSINANIPILGMIGISMLGLGIVLTLRRIK